VFWCDSFWCSCYRSDRSAHPRPCAAREIQFARHHTFIEADGAAPQCRVHSQPTSLVPSLSSLHRCISLYYMLHVSCFGGSCETGIVLLPLMFAFMWVLWIYILCLKRLLSGKKFVYLIVTLFSPVFGWLTIVIQCCDTVGWMFWPVKLSPKWPIMCRVVR